MKIVWEKWIDPYTTEDLAKLNLADVTEEQDFEDFDTDGFIAELEEFIDEPVINHHPIKTIMTPMGVIPIYEHSLPSKIFKFFVGHTDFNISKGILKIIKDTPGVETVDVFTRYRFKIGIGKVFLSKIVLKNVQDNIFSLLENKSFDKSYIEILKNGV